MRHDIIKSSRQVMTINYLKVQTSKSTNWNTYGLLLIGYTHVRVLLDTTKKVTTAPYIAFAQ